MIERSDLVRVTLAVLFIVGLIGAVGLVLRPFVPALLWAAMIVVATWPLMLGLQARLWRRRWLAATAMTVALLLALLVPLALAIGSIASHMDELAAWAQPPVNVRLPDPPAWVQEIPVVGPRVAAGWRELAATGPGELAQRALPYVREVGRWLVTKLGGFGVTAVEFLLTLIFAAILYAHGEAAAAGVRAFARRLAGAQGDDAVLLAGQAIRGVAIGMVGTAIIQAALAGGGLFVAGVPFAVVLTALCFVLTLAQIGPLPVLLSAVAWLYWMGYTGWGTGLLLWSAFVGTIDNVIRPVLIRKGADLPLLLVLIGVFGGLAAFGVLGIFVGPVLLAVAYRLLEAWVRQDPARDSPATPP